MIDVSIPTVTALDDYLLYNVEVTISNDNKGTYKVSKRFSDFVEFKKRLEHALQRPIPYGLPSKYSSLYKRTDMITNERKQGLTQFLHGILNDNDIRSHSTVLAFLGLPEMNLLTSSTAVVIDSSAKWMDNLKALKSILQDVRSKMFSNSNIVDCKKSLNACQARIEQLREYLKVQNELGQGELRRRTEMLDSNVRDYDELSSLLIDLSVTPTTRAPLNQRTLGKPKETEFTKSLDNPALLQQQQLQMAQQDQDLEGLRGIIQRQKQIGTAINEELGIQNDLLKGLRNQVDSSEDKMNNARRKINKIL
ncbi:hypothetical protein CANARDRAFT_217971 [[Candida] arabinofermentans NRRL YB-2248]|uniref:PX domain-containing protein n=1 Tax=[Candida] arabinofermentans NRRL YB-2248 TaxID=983967 RepID=A0A1E4T488_9ASCO|nr:hypothetical protein CANARDRAFT_217971 [[Candida] arabinofermentans NRRL YB-2248]